MKVSSEIFNFISHLILLLTEQHELLIFRLKLNAIHRADDYYIFTRHRPGMLGGERMRRPEAKADGFYITAQSVRRTG